MSEIGGLHLKLPVIAMDGAVLYDLNEKRYLACNGLSKEMTRKICDYLQGKNFHYFLNVVLQDVLLIYYRDFHNEEERKLYERARKSPYRNYVYGDVPEEGIPVYFLLVLKNEDADLAEKELRQMEGAEELLRNTAGLLPFEDLSQKCHQGIYGASIAGKCQRHGQPKSCCFRQQQKRYFPHELGRLVLCHRRRDTGGEGSCRLSASRTPWGRRGADHFAFV